MSSRLRKIVSLNPATNQIYKEFHFIERSDLLRKIEKAHEAFQAQKVLTYTQRSEKLINLANLVDNNADKYAKIITSEMGKPIAQATAEVKKCAVHCRYYANNIEKFLSPH